MHQLLRFSFLRLLLLALGLGLCASPAAAHVGPPFPIVNDYRASDCVLSLWTHPDVGIGTFFVVVEPQSSRKIPADLKMTLGVRPVSGRLPEATYPMVRDSSYGQTKFNAAIPFDRQEMWRIHLVTTSSTGNGDASADVEVTPPGLGAWDLLLYSLPFLGVGLLWFKAMSRKRKRSARAAQ